MSWSQQYFEQADTSLEEARTTLVDAPTDEQRDRWAGRKKKMEVRCGDIKRRLWGFLSHQERSRIEAWLTLSKEQLKREDLCELPTLAQWGLAELLDRLHEVLHLLGVDNRVSEAFTLLVRAHLPVPRPHPPAHKEHIFAGAMANAAHDQADGMPSISGSLYCSGLLG